MTEAEMIPVKPEQDNACEGRMNLAPAPDIQPYFIVMRNFFACMMLFLHGIAAAQTGKLSDTTLMQPVEVTALRASDQAPIAKTNINRQEIRKNNTGADIPFLLNQTVSVQVNSDAGNGIGYTGIRIRGSDASRINVTINGIPYNDAESQGTFFVNIPDILASAGSIQVQRGVGTSTNGAGPFGGNINISTHETDLQRALSIQNYAGSYGSLRSSLQYNSGLLNKKFLVNLRGSHIRSDGYIDRASSRLFSVYGSAAWIDSMQKLQLNVFTGKEKTYQAWYGIDEQTLAGNRTFNPAGTEKPGEPYDNETDNYRQTHYQLFYNRKLHRNWKASIALFYTRGMGYYEQYRADAALSDYGLPDYIQGNDTIRSSDLVRQLWLDNHFYGSTYSVQHEQGRRQVIIGGGWSGYDGDHYGKIPRTIKEIPLPSSYKWYDNDARKTDFNQYVKWTEKLGLGFSAFIDLQYRTVRYRINGFRNNPGVQTDETYHFFNPKVGLTYSKGQTKIYAYYGQAAKEPNRDDFESGINQQPAHETLQDWEAGIEKNKGKFQWSANFFYMKYRNQLVLTGKINDVGAYTRTNIPNSYRAGLELSASWRASSWLQLSGNVALSENKIRNFTEYIDDYDQGGQKTNFYQKTDISFSPRVVSAATVSIFPWKHTEISLMGKYVGRQYLDNTSNAGRQLNAYYVQDLRVRYEPVKEKGIRWNAFVQINNLFSEKYEANGYTFSYFYGGGLNTENYYFPMAPLNVMAGIGINL